MIAATLAFLLVATMISLQSRARQVRSKIEAGTFSGLVVDIESLYATPPQNAVTGGAATAEPLQLAA